MSRRHLFLLLAVLGFVLPYWQLIPWVLEHGPDLGALVTELFSTRIGAFFGLDVMVSAVALLMFIAGERSQLRVPQVWTAVLGTLVVGVSFGLPFYLFLREKAPTEEGSGSPS